MQHRTTHTLPKLSLQVTAVMPADEPAAAAFSFTAPAPAPAVAAPAPAAPAFTFGAAAPAPAPVAAATPAFTFTPWTPAPAPPPAVDNTAFTFGAGAPAPAPAASTPAFTFGAAAPAFTFGAAPAPAAGGPAFTFGAWANSAPPSLSPALAGGPADSDEASTDDEEDDEALARRLQREWEEEDNRSRRTDTWESDEASTELSQLPSDDEEVAAWNVHVSRLESLYDVNVRVIQSPGDWSARALDSGLTKVEQNPAVMRAVEAVGARNVASFTSPEFDVPLLHWAAMAGKVECVRVLLCHGADVEAHTLDGCTPLFYSVPNGEPTVARVLVAAGASTDVENLHGITPLGSTVQYGQPHLTHVLLSLGARFDMAVADRAKAIYMTEQPDPEMLDGVVEAHALHKRVRDAGGSYKKYLLATRMPLVMLRRLAASKRAVPRPDCPPIYKRLFPRAAPLDSEEEDETPVRDIIPPPDIPDEVFLRVLGFWYTV